jgi:hypothetical protein
LKTKHFILVSLLLLIGFASCRKQPQQIGESLLPDSSNIQVEFSGSQNIVAEVQRVDSLSTKSAALALVGDLNDPHFGNSNLSFYTQIGLTSNSLQCGEGAIRDIGVFGKKATGWTVQIGGNSGLNARVGEVLAVDLEDDALIEVLTKLMVYYKENMKPKERMYRFVPRMGGVSEIRKAIGLE